MKHIDIVFDGPTGPDGPRFVEVEASTGESIRIGEWVPRGDGTWALRLPDPEAVWEDGYMAGWSHGRGERAATKRTNPHWRKK